MISIMVSLLFFGTCVGTVGLIAASNVAALRARHTGDREWASKARVGYVAAVMSAGLACMSGYFLFS